MEKSGSITGIRRIAVFASVVLFSVLLGGCGGGGGGGGDGGGSDTTPDAFSFTDRADVPLSAPIASNTITVTGINAAAPISVTDGEYAINGGTYTSTAGTVTNGQTVTVRQTSSDTESLTTTATLTIGGVSASFNVTTCNFDYSGLYTGSGTVNSSATANLTAVHGMWRNERFILFDVGENVLYDGTVQSYSSSGEITGTVNVYKDGVNSQQASITGTATNDNTHPTGITLNLAGAGYGAGSITLSYSAAYHTKWATVGRFSAVFPDAWLGSINTVTNGTPISLHAPTTGNTFTGATGEQVRCNYQNGTKTIPNVSANLYQISFDSVDSVGTCNHVGTNFTGFATVVDNAGLDNLMWFAATNGTYSNFSLLDYIDNP